MYLPVYLVYKLSFFLYPFILIGKKKIGKHTYQITDNIALTLRENSADTLVLWETFTQRTYEFEGFLIKPKDVVVDIGGHIGVFAIYAAKKATKGLVLAYEPVEENFLLLEKNKALNHATNLKIFNTAITPSGESIHLNISASNNAGHSIYAVDTKKVIKVPSITLEEVLEKNNLRSIDYLKIDTEGAEFDIILHTPDTVLKKVDKIVLEYHDYLSPANNHTDLIRHLEQLGFDILIKTPAWQRKIFKIGILLAKNTH